MTSNDQNQTPSQATTPVPAPALAELLHATARLIRFHQAIGVENYPRSEGLFNFLQGHQCPTPREPVGSPKAAALDPVREQRPQPAASPAPSQVTTPPTSLDALNDQMRACQRCPLHAGRQQVVPGQGNPGALLFIVTDAPSTADDRSGQAMSGEAGQLLDKMLTAIGLDRERVFLTALTKCHGHIPPATEAAEACLPFLLDQLSAIRPAIICVMGTLTAQRLLHTNQPLSRLRGRFHDFRGTPVMATFPPEFLLANPEMKKAVWVDLQLIQKKLQEA